MVLPLKIFSSSPTGLDRLINYFWLETRASLWLLFLHYLNHLALAMWAKRFCGQVAKTLAKVTKNWRSLPLPWVTSQKFQVTLGDLGVTIFVNTFITVTWSYGRNPPQLHPPSLSDMSLSVTIVIYSHSHIVTWSHGRTRKPPQVHPLSLSHLSLSLGGLFRSERWMTFARWVRAKPFVRRIT